MFMAGTEPRAKGGKEWVINGTNSYKQLHVHVIFPETLAEGAYIGSTCSQIWEFTKIVTLISDECRIRAFFLLYKIEIPIKSAG